MKRVIDLLIKNYLVVALIFSMLFAPLNTTKAASNSNTLAGLKEQLKELKAKKAEQDNKKKLTQAEIKRNKENLEKTETEIRNTNNQISETQKNIERTNAEIANVKEESAELLILNQKLESENIYLSYITGASTMTELIMRSDMVDMLTSYNNSKLKELELLTDNNKKLQKSLEQYQEKLDKKRNELEDIIDTLGNEYTKMNESSVTIEEEIDNMNSLIKYYEDRGCGENQLFSECLKVSENTGWLKPVSKGVITSLFGYRKAPTPTTGNNHTGIDIGVSEGTNVYAIANGVVGAIVLKSSCGGNKVYIWTTVNGKKYTYTFLHLKEILVKVGDTVDVNTIVAKSGGKSYGYDTCTTGPHLHVGISEGHWFGAAGDKALSKFNSYLINPPGYPGLGQWFYGR